MLETTMSYHVPTKWITQMKWTSSKNTQTIKTDSRRNRKSEQLPITSNLNTTRKIPEFSFQKVLLVNLTKYF